MSLYEQFHSDINKQFMFDMIKDIIQKEVNVDLTEDSQNYEYFLTTLQKIFNENDVDEIEAMNKLLLDYNVDYFFAKFKKQEPIMQDEFEKLLKERESQEFIPLKEDEKDEKGVTDVKDGTDGTDGTDVKDTIGTFIQELNEPKKVKKVKKVKKIIEEDGIYRGQYHYAGDTIYNYVDDKYVIESNEESLDLHKSSISFEKISKVSSLIIPIEDNYLFTIPVLNVFIPELDCNVHMQQEKMIQGNHRSYGVYRAIENHTIKPPTSNRITINIRDVSEKSYNGTDILKVNIVEIKKNKVYLTCSIINENDYQVKDFIKIINNNSYNLSYIFQDPLKIKKIQDNIIICEYRGLEELESKIYTNIDMKIMNMSNQHILYFQ